MTDVRVYGYKHWTTLEVVPRCFNVGKGIPGRAETDAYRNNKWHAMKARFGLRVEICVGPMTNEEACAWEIENIALMGTFTASYHITDDDYGCNFTRGGEGLIGRVQSAKEIERRSVSLKRRYAIDPQLKNDLSAKAVTRWDDAEYHARHVEAIRIQANTPETRERKRQATTKTWADDMSRARRTESNKRRWANPAERARQSERLKAASIAPGAKERRQQASRLMWFRRKSRAFQLKAYAWFSKHAPTL